MSDRELVVKEYQTSKDSIRSVMTQLIAVATSLLAFSLTLLRPPGTAGEVRSPQFLYLVLFSMNFLIVFAVYQNVQILGLQKHIQRLEKALNMPTIFCWESKIARVWYSNSPVAVLFNLCLLTPLGAVVVWTYVELYSLCRADAITPIACVNLVYLVVVISCFVYINDRMDKIALAS